jgi:uncharacterized protein with ParB-like and HNH nuclease domain
MSYLNTTIRNLITEKIGRNTFLPAIQREYVWSPYQVEKLFDSLMCGYPISSFLLWRIREENKKEWISYDFIRDFDEEKPHNYEANLDGVNQDVFLVLDGQQRITSLNIGLRGSYRYFYRKWRKTRLYLNLLWNHDNDNPEELTYQFLFKEDDQPIPRTNYPQFWYRVGDILNYDDISETIDNIETRLSSYTKDEIAQARRIITKLYSVINVTEVINYYEEKSDNYDKVLEIFIRTNTGGQKLEYSDILLSTATAKWKDLNAREEINNFTDEINKIGVGYNFGKDFVMKGAMYLTEDLPIQYKLSSFTQSNLEKIEDHWDTTKEAIRNAVLLISRYGFNDKNLVTKLALLPIAQYLRNICNKNYVVSTKVDDVIDQNNIQKWLVFIILKNGLGGSSDTKLTQMRKIVDAKYDRFPYAELNREMLIESSFNDMELESLLKTNYGTRYSYLILSLLYPGRDWKDKIFNEDHIFPQTEFQRKKLKARGYDDEKIELYLSSYNSIANLELLDDSENKIKNAKPFEEWLSDRDDNFKSRHHIPQMENYCFDNFISFIEKRKELLIESLSKISFED